MQSLSLRSWATLPTFKPDACAKSASERSSAGSASSTGSGSARPSPRTPSPRVPEHRDPPHARNNLKQLQDLHGRHKPATPRRPGHAAVQARAAALPDAPVASAAHAAPGWLDRPDILALACSGWAAGVGVNSGAGVANTLADGAGPLPATLFTSGAFNFLCSCLDTGLTLHAWHEARQQYRAFESLLGMQHLVLHQLQARLRLDPDPSLQAARDLAQFNAGALNGLLEAFEKAYLSPAERPLAKQRRQWQLDHLVTADEALRLRQQALAYPDQRRRDRADRAERRRDALQARIAALDASSPSPLERLREGLNHPIDWFQGLSDEQVAFLRDGVLQGAKLPFQLFTALTTLLTQLIDSGAAGAALGIVGDVAGPVAVLLALLGLLTAQGDQRGGHQRTVKARAARRARLTAFENTVWQLHPASVDPQADPAQVQQLRRVCHNLARQLAKAIQRTNEAKGVARARRIRGQLSRINLLLLGIPGLMALLAEATVDAGIPALVAGGALGLWFLSQLARYQGYLASDKRRMRRRHKEALAFGDPDGARTARLYAGQADGDPALPEARRQALSANPYLSIGWLQGQLYAVGRQAAEAGGGEPPWCDAERLLLNVGVSADTLRQLRRAVWVRTPQGHGQLVRAVATGAIGLRPFLSGEGERRLDPAGTAHEAVPVLRTHAAQASGPFARLADLDDAVKAAGKTALRRDHHRVARLALRLAPKSLATPKQARQRLERHAARGETEALAGLRRDLLGHLLNQMPRRADGLGIAWPGHYRRGQDDPDTADCLLAYLGELKETCRLGDMALAHEAHKERWSDRWMRKRLADYAALVDQLEEAVRQERGQPSPWWDGAVEHPPVFRCADEEAAWAERAQDGSQEDGPGPAALPAYAIRV